MSGHVSHDSDLIFDELAPERYELDSDSWQLTRRDLFGVLGGGLVIALAFPRTVIAQESGRRGSRGRFASMPQGIGAWLHIGPDSAITGYTGKVEIGQNIRTSLAQVVAEELHVPITRIRLVTADTAHTPFDIGTFGSMTTPVMAAQLSRIAAAAREAILDLAALHAKVDRANLTITDGKVTGSQGKPSFEFGELTKGTKLVKLATSESATTAPQKWTVAGQSVPKVDGRAFVTGHHLYASDMSRPGMLRGAVLRPPGFQAKLVSLESREAQAIPGVKVVHDGEFIGVVAPSEEIANEAIAALKAEWKSDPEPGESELFTWLKSHPTQSRGFEGGGRAPRGSIADGMKAANHKLSATYTIAYIAHVPLEPRAAIAEWSSGKLTVWTTTQRPFGVRTELAGAFGLPVENVHVIVPDMGSAYGGKHTGEAAVEAARLAKTAGKPVKIVWTREEEFTWAYFRPAGVIEISAGVTRKGLITAWECHNYNSGASALSTPYDVPNTKHEFHAARSPLRQGSYRALAATANVFARECHMTDLAVACGQDPLAFRLKNLKDARLQAVLEAAAKEFGWAKDKPGPGQGIGISCGTEKGSYVAACALVAAERGKAPRVLRVVTAFECGAILNPEHLKNQVEGAVMMSLGGAIFERIRFNKGRILNASLSAYRVPRFRDMPVMETVLVDRKDLPAAGAGETPMVALAPAVRNAILNATGIKLCSLPLAPDGLAPP
jgi:nicotinate dehydrogenase subunit B